MAYMSAILSPAQTADKPKLLDQVRDVIRRKHFSIRTEQTYVEWIKRYIFFHGKRHPNEMAEAEITAFLTHLARAGKVAASTPNQHVKASLTCRKRLQEQQRVLRLRTSLGSRLGFLHRLHEQPSHSAERTQGRQELRYGSS
jgi:Phage integrase, N-terminal SAM-like domain